MIDELLELFVFIILLLIGNFLGFNLELLALDLKVLIEIFIGLDELLELLLFIGYIVQLLVKDGLAFLQVDE